MMLITVTWHDPDIRSRVVEVRKRPTKDDYFLGGILNQAMRQAGYTEATIHAQHYVGPVEFKFHGTQVKIQKICSECGSTDVCIDAWADWSEAEQDWVLHSTYESAFCNGCEQECDIEDKEITPC